MPQGEPRSGEKYLHFKNKLYQIVTLAKHSETDEILVIYQALYDDFAVYARPLKMFIGEVDHQKYPEVTQKYRFMLVNDTAKIDETKQKKSVPENLSMHPEVFVSVKQTEITVSQGQPEHSGRKDITQLLMKFYDADSYEEKYKILLLMREDITDVMINNMAVVLDVVIPEGDLDVRYEELKKCLRTYQKYETGRLR